MTGTVLFVCTANQCRSPMAETLARAVFAERDLKIDVRSAGELAGGHPATKHAERVMATRGLDLTGHVSHHLDASLVGSSGLILTMERRHLGAVAAIDLGAVGRSFPLREFVRIAAPRQDEEPLGDWIERVDAARDPHRILTFDTSDDVADPIGGTLREYRRCADALEALVDTLGNLIVGFAQ